MVLLSLSPGLAEDLSMRCDKLRANDDLCRQPSGDNAGELVAQ